MYGISFHFGPLLEECVQRDRGERLVLVSPQSKMNLSHHLSSTTINQVSPIFPIKKSCPSFFPMFLLIKTWFPFIFSTINQLFPYHFPTFYFKIFSKPTQPCCSPHDFVWFRQVRGLHLPDRPRRDGPGQFQHHLQQQSGGRCGALARSHGKKPWEAGNSYGFGWENGWENGWDIIIYHWYH